MKRTEGDRLAANRQKIAALQMENARLKKQMAERRRKTDTRRKIVAGSLALAHAEIDPDFAAALYRLLNRFVLARDRHLFDLPPKDEPSSAPPGADGGPMPNH